MFAGLIDPTHDPNTASQLIELATLPTGLATIPYDDTAYWQSENYPLTLVQQRRWNSLGSKQLKGMVSHAPSRTRIVAWARIDNREELISHLPPDLHALCASDDGLILASYLHWAESACEHLIGDFAFAIFDGRDHSLYCGRDHTGVKPFYYYFDGKRLAFATSLAVLNQLPTLDLDLSEQWLARFLVRSSQDWTATVYQRITKLPPAHTLRFSSAVNKPVLRQYFAFSPESDLILARDEDYVEAYREALHQAVACRVRSDYPIGSESSGGLDSSSVTALAAKHMPNPGRNLHAFGFDEAELTPACIIAVSQATPMAMTHFVTKKRNRDGHIQQRFDQCHGAPLEHGNGTSHYPVYDCAQKLGIRTLLSGFGGDEFVTSAAPVALVEFWRNHDWRLFLSRQRGNFLKLLHTSRWVYLYYRHNNHSITARRFVREQKPFWDASLIHEDVIARYQLKDKMAQNSRYDGGKIRQNDFALQDRWSPMMTARYENCTLMAAHYGIDYRWPLMDIRLLKLFLSIPASQKLGPGSMGRYLHRRAVANVLPASITWQSKDMEPFRFWQRLGLWAGATPLARAIKREHLVLTAGSTSALKPNEKAHEKTKGIQADQGAADRGPTLNPAIPEFDARLASLLDPGKVQQAVKLLSTSGLSKNQTRLLQRQLQTVRELDRWLKAQSKDTIKS